MKNALFLGYFRLKSKIYVLYQINKRFLLVLVEFLVLILILLIGSASPSYAYTMPNQDKSLIAFQTNSVLKKNVKTDKDLFAKYNTVNYATIEDFNIPNNVSSSHKISNMENFLKNSPYLFNTKIKPIIQLKNVKLANIFYSIPILQIQKMVSVMFLIAFLQKKQKPLKKAKHADTILDLYILDVIKLQNFVILLKPMNQVLCGTIGRIVEINKPFQCKVLFKFDAPIFEIETILHLENAISEGLTFSKENLEFQKLVKTNG